MLVCQSLRTIPMHANIIPLYDAFLLPTTKELYFVFECMEGNLYQLTKSRRGPPLGRRPDRHHLSPDPPRPPPHPPQRLLPPRHEAREPADHHHRPGRLPALAGVPPPRLALRKGRGRASSSSPTLASRARPSRARRTPSTCPRAGTAPPRSSSARATTRARSTCGRSAPSSPRWSTSSRSSPASPRSTRSCASAASSATPPPTMAATSAACPAAAACGTRASSWPSRSGSAGQR